MLFRQRVSSRGAFIVRRRAHGEMATHRASANARPGSPSLYQSSSMSHSVPSPVAGHANKPPSLALPFPKDCRWKRGRPVTFSARVFSTNEVEAPARAEDATYTRRATDNSRGCQELDKDPFQSGYGAATAIRPNACAYQHHSSTSTQADHEVTDEALSSENHRTADEPKPPSASTHSTLSSAEKLEYPESGSSVQKPSPGSSMMSGNIGLDYTSSCTDESAHSSRMLDSESAEAGHEAGEIHTPLGFQIPENLLRTAMSAPENSKASFWSNTLYRGPRDQKIQVHYCKTKEIAERVAHYFVNEKVLGFDIEWKPYAPATSIKKNVSLIQLACEDRIALFHVALFAGNTAAQLMPPTLKAILETPDAYKVGVAVKGDFSRLVKFLEIEPQGVFELSRLHNLVQFSATEPSKVTNKLVGLAAQVQLHLQLPLYKGGHLLDDPEDSANVRSSDWSMPLNSQQIHYAAADAYAGYRLYDALEEKRMQLKPTPPRPLVCDYDSKPKPKPTSVKPRKKRETASKLDNATVAVAERGAISSEQKGDAVEKEAEEGQTTTQESEETDATDGYETAQEEFIDSHQLESEGSRSASDRSELTSESEKASSTDSAAKKEPALAGTNRKRVGRVDLSQLRRPDPGYPIIPELGNSCSSSDTSIVDLDTPGEGQLEGDGDIVAPRGVDASDTDEFEDSELEEEMRDLSIYGDGEIQRNVVSDRMAGSFTLIGQHTSPESGLGEQQDEQNVDTERLEQAETDQSGSQAQDYVHHQEERQLIELLKDPKVIEYLGYEPLPVASERTNVDTLPSEPPRSEPQTLESTISFDPPASSEITSPPVHTSQYALATNWAKHYLSTSIPSPRSSMPSHIRATIPHLRAYHMWAQQHLEIPEIATCLSISEATAGSYVLQAIVLERIEYDVQAVKGVLMGMPEALRRGKWRALAEKLGAT